MKMNKMKTLTIILFVIIPFLNTISQEKRFFMPSEIKKAYEKGTRSFDGNPGKNYWQNFADYHIKVEIIPSDRLISGYEKVIYKNSSPDYINSLVIRLYADVYKKGNSRAFGVDKRDIDDGVELSEVFINGEKINTEDAGNVRRRGTNITFTLQKPLEPGKELVFETKWKQKIPYSNIRNGFIDSTTFFIGDWYPQIAVYDDIFGWDQLNYTLQTEFYNNLGNFDVEITLPDKFLVWATGTLVNSEKVLPKEVYDKFIKAKSSSEVVNIVSRTDHENGIKTLSNTWHFKAGEVSDFAFGLSDHYLWDGCIQKVDNREVLINSVYPLSREEDCKPLTGIQQKSMKYLSENVPGVPYPYESFTTFIGSEGGGMEYPMMANNGGPYEGVTIHEMFHTYFPMYVRTNERRWAWMDEGWADYNTSVVENWFINGKKEFENIFSGSKYIEEMIGSISDLPLITSSEYLVDNYSYASYPLPSCVYTIIHQHLGDELFFKCYKEYIRRWAKKSPAPYDFFYTFENVSGQDLSWIWKPWFFEFGSVDLGIQSFVKEKLTIVNIGNKPVPLFVDIEYKDGTKKQIVQSAKIWASVIQKFDVKIPDYKNVKKISINKKIADCNQIDNYYPSIKELTTKVQVLDNIFGQYKTERFPALINIIKEDGLIYLVIKEFSLKEALVLIDMSTLSTLDENRKIIFLLNESGTVTGLEISSDNFKLEAKKL